MTDIRNFPTATILTAYTGKMLVHDIGKVYDILGFLTADKSIMTHQLPEAMDAMKSALLEQLPWLAEVPPLLPIPDDVSAEQWVGDYLADIIAEHGAEHDLHSAPHLWGEHDPLADLAKKRPDMTVVPIVVAPEAGR